MTRAGDLCLSSAGARVTLATSSDDRHPANNIIDGNTDTFWTTTGMYPQEFIISLNGIQKINKIILQSSLVRSVRIESSTSKEPVNFELRLERDLENTEEHLQFEEFTLPGIQVAHIRFVILSGFDHFASVHRVSAEGDK
ncbi:heat shock protein family B (small) member 11 L homeolog [Xenopus laevis]|uniref:Intraflagellar transport protein 25 homolog n=2 Tax=Xenopus laevis TaxID=8355 RepID=Q66GV7_XENLA|nr:intraflagellar transport 25 L homeolog [Xenopus laevis]AAH82207.1 MGC99123 protein [Xenopus laevis]OCT85037.1 hypothetical protein XELAEV_18023200mg [Xenopus laevis]